MTAKRVRLEDLKLLSERARYLARELAFIRERGTKIKAKTTTKRVPEQLAAEDLSDNMVILAARIFEKLRPQMYQIIQRQLKGAIAATEEFDEPTLKTNIESAFLDSELISLDVTRYRINLHPEVVAGTQSQYSQGVWYARKKLAMKLTGTQAQRAWFWKNAIYNVARRGAKSPLRKRDRGEEPQDYGIRKYQVTIRTRVEGWSSYGALAPYWYMLEHGTAKYGSGGAWPSYKGTNFVYIARRKCQVLFDSFLQRYINELMSKQRYKTVTERERVFSRTPQARRADELLKFLTDYVRRYLLGEFGQIPPGTKLGEILFPISDEEDIPMMLHITKGSKLGLIPGVPEK